MIDQDSSPPVPARVRVFANKAQQASYISTPLPRQNEDPIESSVSTFLSGGDYWPSYLFWIECLL